MIFLSIWVVVGLTNYFISTALFGAGRSKAVFWFSAIQLPIMFGFCATVVPTYGGLGAAIALVATSAIGNLLYAYLIGTQSPELGKQLLMTLAATQLPLLACAYFITIHDFSLWERIGCGMLTLVMLFAAGGIRLSEIKYIYSSFRAKVDGRGTTSSTIS